MKRESIKRDIAIIGISCKFSKTEDLNQFWENLKEGNEMIQFYTDEELLEEGIDKSIINNPDYVKIKTFLDNSDSFDYPFFGYTKDEANLMDPQIRLLHEQVWLALEDAGYNSSSYLDKIGIYMTAADNFNWIAHSLMSENKNVDPFFLSHINNKNFISTLISYSLNLKGPSVFIDTACSSSLATVHLASRSLLLRECSLAIAGGINLYTKKDKGYFYKEGMISSKDGHCRTFDSESTGTMGSEGTAVVVLKRLEEAIIDKDNIYAVIRSTAVNNDGKRKVGFTAPSVIGQADCIEMAHNIAKVPYNTISYIEAHGTATHLGDPVEIESLNKAFNYDTSHDCAIGSLKSNLGHLGNAAGIAGLVKTVLALKNKMIPASLHYSIPNPKINFKGGPFYVNSELKKWEKKDSFPLRAGVSSFGIGGTNAHVILEEFENEENQSNSRPFQLILYSAKSQSSLKNYSIKLKEFVNKKMFNLADLSYTLKIGRESFLYKKFMICENNEEVLFKLNETINDKNQISVEKNNKNLVFMFPGQGSQYFKMGKDLYKHEPLFKIFMDEGFKILFDLTGEDYSEIIGYDLNENIDANLINETRYTQPILFLIEYALASLLLKWEIKPSYMIGHSLGEYVAACIANVFSIEDALKLIVRRSQLMSEIERGVMIAIGVSVNEVIELLTKDLSIAAINSETSCVVSGNKNAIADFIQVLTLNEIPFSQLKTSHAFHSEMMDVILEEYEKELNSIKLSKPKFPFISNLTGKQILAEEATSTKYWVKHVRGTVNFKDGIDFLLKEKDAIYLEIGPGKTLLTFSKQNKYYSSKNTAIELLGHFNESIDDNRKFTNAIGEIWNQGIKINWKEYYSSEVRTRISVPTYSFDNYKLDFIVDPFHKLTENSFFNDIKPFNEWFYIPNWKKSFLSKKGQEIKKNQNYLILSNKGKLITSLKDQLLKEKNTVIEVERGTDFECYDKHSFRINPVSENDFISLFKNLGNNKIEIEQVLFNWDFEGEDQETMLSTFLIFNNLCKCLINYFPNSKKKITLLCSLNHAVTDDRKSNISMISSMKQLYVCSQENPNIFSCSIDIEQENDDSETIQKIIGELKYNYSDTTVAFRNSIRWVEFYENISLETDDKNKYIKENKVYLITGGMGNVGKILAAYLSDTYSSKVIIIGRSSIPSEDLWENLLNDISSDSKKIDIIQNLKKLKRENRQIFYYNADVSDYDAFYNVIKNIESDHGKISGVIHAAGNIDKETFKPIENLNSEIALKQFLPKIKGTVNIYNIFKNNPLDFIWVTSSLASVLGGLTFGAYSVANAFIDSFICNKKEELQNWFCVNLDGITEERINHQKLIEVFEKSFFVDLLPQVIISVKDPNSFKLNQNSPIDETKSSDIDRSVISVDYLAPSTIMEEELCQIIQSFFGYKKIGVLDNFFEMGGDSLKAMTVIKRVNKLFGVELSIQDFYLNPTVKKFSEELELAIKFINLQEKVKGENTIII
jgi:phthiocerol/phenolphthiocerol synthesis type-I polyketide synthase E